MSDNPGHCWQTDRISSIEALSRQGLDADRKMTEDIASVIALCDVMIKDLAEMRQGQEALKASFDRANGALAAVKTLAAATAGAAGVALAVKQIFDLR